MTQPYQKLFNTIQEIAAAGKVKLSVDERAIIERETKDLISKSQAKNYKFASTVPQGFEALLEDLRGADAETAYKLVMDFMDEPDGKPEAKPDFMDDGPDKGDAPDFGGGKEDKPDFGGDKEDKPAPFESKDDGDKPDFGGDKEDKEDKAPPFESKSDDKEDKGEPDTEDKPTDKGDKDKDDKPKDKDDKKDDKKEDAGDKPSFIEDKEKVLARIKKRRAQEGLPKAMPDEMDGQPMDKGDGPKFDGKGPHGTGKGKMRDLKEKDKNKERKPSMDEMGIDDKEVDPTITMRAKKIRVKITAERNVIAYHEDHGPVFLLKPTADQKKSRQAMTRIANRAYGLSVYEGFAVAAKKLGAKLFHTAGVDDDVELVTEETPETPVTDGVLEDAETVADQEPDDKDVDDDTQAEADDDIEVEPVKIARYKKLKKSRRASDDIAAEADTVTEEKPEARPSEVTDGEDDVTAESIETPSSTVIDDDEVDFKTAKKLEANYRKLYASRLKKAEEAFVKKFARCMRIASKRMQLNYDENPMKVASADVLMSDNVEFENGEHFRAMPEHVAVQLTELISTEGHEDFVRNLMDRTADLMEKSSEYLEDVETDISRLRPVAVSTSTASAPPKREARANTMRRAASAGNFGLTDKEASASPMDTETSLRAAMNGTDTRVNRDLGRLRR